MNALQRVCRTALCAPIRLYRRFLSKGAAQGRKKCRFTPTCSEYAITAIETHGCFKGLLLALWRVARCQPFAKWGFDPVPEPGRWKNPKRILYPPRR